MIKIKFNFLYKHSWFQLLLLGVELLEMNELLEIAFKPIVRKSNDCFYFLIDLIHDGCLILCDCNSILLVG